MPQSPTLRGVSMPDVDISDKLGYNLLKKGIIDYETLESAIRKKESEDPEVRSDPCSSTRLGF